ncbi:MAG TPA: RNA polymerase sigma factor [Ktedonobacteraceae bacterium]|nr:RNA polymerase sigma factor [Ktedonobacteraceae bacterium]
MFSAIHGGSLDEPARENDASGALLVQVVEQARGGDSQAFSALFQQYNSQICMYLARLVGNDEVGRDLAQETFLRAWQSLPSIRHDERFSSWLFRIATNTARSHLRHAKRIRWLPWQDQPDGIQSAELDRHLRVEGPETQAGDAEIVQKCLARVSPQCRVCLLLQLVAGFSQREVAETLGISEKSVSANVSRGREQFRREYHRLKGVTA